MKGLRLVMVAALFSIFGAPVAEPNDTPDQLRARLASETDLIRKARLEVRLAETELDEARREYSAGEIDKGAGAIGLMMTYVEQAFSHLNETNRDPRKRPAGFKDTEIKLRGFVRKLDDLAVSLALDERPPVEKAASRIREIDEDLLLGIMRVKNRKKEKVPEE